MSRTSMYIPSCTKKDITHETYQIETYQILTHSNFCAVGRVVRTVKTTNMCSSGELLAFNIIIK